MNDNLAQDKAINKTKGPCIILAGAGTGKTYTIRQKLIHLIKNNHYKPEEILCLTFSNEATNNLKKKVSEDLKEKANNIVIKTFHSFCSEIIRENSLFFKINTDFKIIDPDNSKVLIHKYFDVSPYYSSRYISTIQNCKDFGITIEDISKYSSSLLKRLKEFTKEENLEEEYLKKQKELRTIHLETNHLDKDVRKTSKDYKKELKEFISIYEDYQKYYNFLESWKKYETLKSEKNYLDYGDLNKLVLEFFTEMGSSEYSSKYKYVFIDEFQDTNKLQFDLIKYIAEHRNITVVGDLNQSIYGFRGAYRESFEHFIKDFQVDRENDLFKLDKSYRSSNKILNTSYDLIKNNYENKEECINIKNADNREGENVKVISLKDKFEEARFITDKILEKQEEGLSLNRIAVLVRTHKQAETIRQALVLKKIPFVYKGSSSLLEYGEIKTVIAYLSVLNNLISKKALGEQAWWYLFHYENTLSPKDAIKIGRYLKKNNKEEKSLDEILLDSSIELSEKGKVIVERIVLRLKQIISISNKRLPEIILDIYQITGLNRRFTYDRSIENTEHLLNLKKFYEISVDFIEFHDPSIGSFIDYLEILDKLDVNINASSLSNKNAVNLMTIHACKGLEFDTVFLSNLAENRFPIKRTPNEPLIPKELYPDKALLIEKTKKENPDVSLSSLEKVIKEKIKEYEKEIFAYEERRLCYVAFTRAENHLYLTHARSYNQEEESANPSPFLKEINYLENKNIEFLGNEEMVLSSILSPDTKHEKYKSLLKEQIVSSLDVDSLDSLVKRISKYFAIRENNSSLQEIISEVKIDNNELLEDILRYKENNNSLVLDKEIFTFSPTSLMTYLECPKKFELSVIYRMPEVGSLDELVDLEEGEGSALSKGSFVHKVCEDFVISLKEDFSSLEEISRNIYLKDPLFLNKLSEKDYKESLELLKVFYERFMEKKSIGNISSFKTEYSLSFSLEGYNFYGKVDRIDYLKGKDEGFVDIIDYKTNKSPISPEKRKIQLGFYALGLISQGFKINKLILDLLKLESPVEMVVSRENQNDVIASVGCNKTSNFSLEGLKREILDVSSAIEKDYGSEFSTLTKEDKINGKCNFCGYKFYCPLWKD
jgi:DNA helicase II / ATP-dependent DNA helicase PcrA